MHVTEVLHEVVDSIRTGLSDTNRHEMHSAVSDLEELWRDLHPKSAPAERPRDPEPEPDVPIDHNAARDKEIEGLRGEVTEVKGSLAEILALLRKE